MPKVTCEHRNNYTYGMSYFRYQCSDPQFRQDVIREPHADQKGLQYCYQIDQHKEYRGFMYRLLAVRKNKKF